MKYKDFVSARGFSVLEGSTVSNHVVLSPETRGKSYTNLRNALVNEGVIVDRIYTRDYELNASSAVSAVVMGHTSNVNVDWKTADGTKRFVISANVRGGLANDRATDCEGSFKIFKRSIIQLRGSY